MASTVNGLTESELSAPLRAALQKPGIRDLPTPSEGVKWSVLTDHVNHLALVRLERAGYIAHARRHEARIGLIDRGGRGLWRTTRDLFHHHHLLTAFRTAEPIGPGHDEWVFGDG